jgi:hypothetical protein
MLRLEDLQLVGFARAEQTSAGATLGAKCILGINKLLVLICLCHALHTVSSQLPSLPVAITI